jgi:hypothetical protein
MYTALHLEVEGEELKVLPLLVGSQEDRRHCLAHLPLLAEKKYLVWENNPEAVYTELAPMIESRRRRSPA